MVRDWLDSRRPAEVTDVAAIGLDVTFNTTPDDLTTALELRLMRSKHSGSLAYGRLLSLLPWH